VRRRWYEGGPWVSQAAKENSREAYEVTKRRGNKGSKKKQTNKKNTKTKGFQRLVKGK
jgi:hypothetical protein